MSSQATAQAKPENKPAYRPTRADIVREASRRVPSNPLNLPEGFHRSDLLHAGVVKKIVPREELLRANGIDLNEGKYTDEGPLLILDDKVIRSAYVPLDYSEGFPTLPSGIPFWGQLDFEPIEAFKTFEEYVKQGTDEGARRLFSLACSSSIQRRVAGCLSSDLTANPSDSGAPDPQQQEQQQQQQPASLLKIVDSTETSESISDAQYLAKRSLVNQVNAQLKEWYTIYYWGPRARAHDIFYLDGIRQGQGMMALKLQNDHFQDSTTLYHRLLDYIEGSDPAYQTSEGLPRFWAEMTPRVAIDFLNAITRMSRTSVGLPATGPTSVDSPNSAVNLLQSLISGNPATASKRGPGRPPESSNNSHAPLQPTGNVGPLAGSLAGAGTQRGGGEAEDFDSESTARRILILLNSAKQRRDSSTSDSDSDSDSDEGDN